MRSSLLLSILLAACSSDGRRGSGTADLAAPFLPGSDAATGAPPDTKVYGHSASFLYSIDPDTLQVQPIGAFQWPTEAGGSDEMTDIALDKDARMIGISYSRIYAVDKTNAKCTFLSSFAGDRFNGLSFLSAEQAGGAEILVGAATDGSVVAIDPMTGDETPRGAYGGGFGSSGDLVSVMGATYATASGGGFFELNDTLVRVNPSTGVATKIGTTGVSGIYGLAYWKQKLFGFTASSGMVTIDIATGQATPVMGTNVSWYGAGVTTAAPITID
jgi:hypothetical protein